MRAFFVGIVVSVVVCGLGVFLLRDPFTSVIRSTSGAVFTGSLCVSFLTCISVHEIGHVSGARLFGMSPVLVSVGPVLMVRADSGLRVRLNRVALLSGGAALSAPERWTSWQSARSAQLAFALGGPVASVLFAIGCAVLFARGLVASPSLNAVLFLCAVISGLLGAGNLIPVELGGGLRSDGKQAAALRVATPGDGTVELNFIRMLSTRVRPRAWDRAAISALTHAPLGGRQRIEALTWLSWNASDCGDIDTARAQLNDAIALQSESGEATSAGVRRATADDLAMHAALFEAVWFGAHVPDALLTHARWPGVGERLLTAISLLRADRVADAQRTMSRLGSDSKDGWSPLVLHKYSPAIDEINRRIDLALRTQRTLMAVQGPQP